MYIPVSIILLLLVLFFIYAATEHSGGLMCIVGKTIATFMAIMWILVLVMGIISWIAG